MGRRNRKSKKMSIEEKDVFGPLNLEEAKSMGEVPEDFKVDEEPEGLLQRASHILLGDSKPEVHPPEEAASEKRVTFEDEQPASGAKSAQKRKSFWDFFRRKKASKEELPSHPVEIVEKPAPVLEEIAEEAKAEVPTEESAADVVEGHAESEDQKHKRKSMFTNLFNHKKEGGAASGEHPEGAESAEVVEAVKEKADDNEAIAEATEAAAEPTQEAAKEENDGLQETIEPTPEKKKRRSVFSGLFKKKESNVEAPEAAPAEIENVTEAEAIPAEEQEQSEGILSRIFGGKHEEEAGPSEGHGEAVAAGAVIGGGAATAAVVAANKSESETGEEEAAAPSSDATPDKKKKLLCRGCCQIKPAEDAEVIKVGEMQKRSHLFKWNRLRRARLMSDGVFQWVRNGDDWKFAKGCKLTPDMKVEKSDNLSQFPAVVTVSIGKCYPIVLSFKEAAERDEWVDAFNNLKDKLVAAAQDSSETQVLKSSTVEQASGTGQ